MKILKIVGIVFVVIIAVLAVVIATRPPAFKISRSIVINAPADTVFPLINDFHQWGQWSPWEKIDPNLQRTYSGPTAGVGAIYAWSSKNNDVGDGRMTIQESKPSEQIHIKLEFLKPFEATNEANFTLSSDKSGGTQVTWAMEGRNNFICKAFSLFMDMDKMIGADFEKGLAAMKTVAEASVKK